MTIPRPALILGWLGVVPFAAFSLLSVTGTTALPFGPQDGLFLYGALILSFMGGVQWGLAAVRADDPDGHDASRLGLRLSLSVLPALAGFGLWFTSATLALIGLAISFALLLVYDLRTVSEGVAPRWYGPLRVQLSTAVVSLLLLSAVFGAG